jgi:hypothetical protein
MEPGNPFGQGAQHLAKAVYVDGPSGLALIRRHTLLGLFEPAMGEAWRGWCQSLTDADWRAAQFSGTRSPRGRACRTGQKWFREQIERQLFGVRCQVVEGDCYLANAMKAQPNIGPHVSMDPE